jgi:hypothetical protein
MPGSRTTARKARSPISYVNGKWDESEGEKTRFDSHDKESGLKLAHTRSLGTAELEFGLDYRTKNRLTQYTEYAWEGKSEGDAGGIRRGRRHPQHHQGKARRSLPAWPTGKTGDTGLGSRLALRVDESDRGIREWHIQERLQDGPALAASQVRSWTTSNRDQPVTGQDRAPAGLQRDGPRIAGRRVWRQRLHRQRRAEARDRQWHRPRFRESPGQAGRGRCQSLLSPSEEPDRAGQHGQAQRSFGRGLGRRRAGLHGRQGRQPGGGSGRRRPSTPTALSTPAATWATARSGVSSWTSPRR